MFTGLVETTGTIRTLERGAGGARLIVDAPFAAELEAGESVAVDGCCLTQLSGHAEAFTADLSPETLRCTSLGERRAGEPVHLERALALGARLGGHLVQGHVDGVVELLSSVAEGHGLRQRFSLDGDGAFHCVPKGSIAVDGVSLTIATLGPDWFEVALVPHTLEVTAMGRRAIGHRANVEFDLVGKYLLRAAALSGRVELPESVRRELGVMD